MYTIYSISSSKDHHFWVSSLSGLFVLILFFAVSVISPMSCFCSFLTLLQICQQSMVEAAYTAAMFSFTDYVDVANYMELTLMLIVHRPRRGDLDMIVSYRFHPFFIHWMTIFRCYKLLWTFVQSLPYLPFSWATVLFLAAWVGIAWLYALNPDKYKKVQTP